MKSIILISFFSVLIYLSNVLATPLSKEYAADTWVDIRSFPNFSTAATSPSTAGKTILVTSAVNVNNLTVPNDRAVEVVKGGSINIAGNKILNILGPFKAGLYPVFTGSKNVVFGPGAVAQAHPEWWGAKADGSDEKITTAAIQAAVNSNSSPIVFSKGIYCIDGPIHVSAPVLIKGAGQFNTFILQTNSSAGAFFYNFKSFLPGGGLEDISIHAGKLFNTGTGSSGIAVELKNSNGGFSSRRFDIQGFATGIKVTSSFYSKFQDFQVLYARDYGILLGTPIDSLASAGGFISKAKVSNYGYTDDNSKSIGLKIEQSSGDFIDTVDVTSFQKALVIKPSPGFYVTYLFMNQFLADSSEDDNITIDGSQSSIAAIEFIGSWAAYSQKGSGIRITGVVDGMQWTGGRIRENGRHGVVLDGGSNVSFSNTHIAKNSKLATLAYNGVQIRKGSIDSAFYGCRIGNFASGMTHEQGDGIHIEKEFDGLLMINACNLRNQGTGKLEINNLSKRRIQQ